MNVEHLVTMANDIAAFFDGEMGPAEAHKGVVLHLARYWDPRMRRQIIQYALQDGSRLSPSAATAIRELPPVS
jgi:formate dehydrogenase subunit delta